MIRDQDPSGAGELPVGQQAMQVSANGFPEADGIIVTASRLSEIFAASRVGRPDDSIGFLLWRVAHRHQREVDRVLAPLDVSHLQFVVLVQTGWLGRLGDRVTQPGLAGFGRIHPMQLSSVLKRLEAKGLVERRRCPAKPGVNCVILCESAFALLAAALPLVSALQETFFGDDPVFAEDLHSRLRRLVSSWSEED